MNEEEIKKENNQEKDLKEQLDDCLAQKEEFKNFWQRERADFINYKKEEAKRCSELSDYSKISIFLDLISAIDHFEMALKSIPKEMENKPEIIGIINIKKQLDSILKNNGVQKIECLEKPFDPQTSEIIEEIEQEGDSQKVIEEVQVGYKFKDKIIRTAKVKITK